MSRRIGIFGLCPCRCSFRICLLRFNLFGLEFGQTRGPLIKFGVENSNPAKVTGDDGRFRAIDTYFAGDDNETEGERRRSLLRLLSWIRPQLADLLGVLPADEEI